MRKISNVLATAAVCVAATGAGCSTRTYRVEGPGPLQGVVDEAIEQEHEVDETHVRLLRRSGFLVIELTNRGASEARLASASRFVDARGRSFAIESQSIGPGQTARLLAPPRPRYVASPMLHPSDRPFGPVDHGGIASHGPMGPTYQEIGPRFEWPEGESISIHLVIERDETTSPIDLHVTRER